jgi:hypothetical protein
MKTQLDCGLSGWQPSYNNLIPFITELPPEDFLVIAAATRYIDLERTAQKTPFLRCSSQYSALLSTHPNDLLVNVIELPDS